jgi:thymidylate synthase
MKAYLDIVSNVLLNGKWKGNRTGIRTLTVPNQVFSHNMDDGFPLLTTKKMPLKTIAVELEGFIQGRTDKKWYQERGCHIWDEWANPRIVDKIYNEEQEHLALSEIHGFPTDARSKKEIQKECNDLGVVYGYQWRRFNQVYDEDDSGCTEQYDQLKTIVDTLQNNPDDRRMVCSAWNPVQMTRMALPPCHMIWNLCHINGVLNMGVMMRSVDTFLGLPFNIASYGLLLLLLSKEGNMTAGNLSMYLTDCHIYENHIEQIRKQIGREPKDLPKIYILNKGTWTPNNMIKQEDKIILDNKFNMFEWTHQDIRLEHYDSWPKLSGEVAV